jgi:hypothetical protein
LLFHEVVDLGAASRENWLERFTEDDAEVVGPTPWSRTVSIS